jgi:hypothetical protein
MENASKASIHLRNPRDLRERFSEFMSLQGKCKSFTTEFNDPVFASLLL